MNINNAISKLSIVNLPSQEINNQ